MGKPQYRWSSPRELASGGASFRTGAEKGDVRFVGRRPRAVHRDSQSRSGRSSAAGLAHRQASFSANAASRGRQQRCRRRVARGRPTSQPRSGNGHCRGPGPSAPEPGRALLNPFRRPLKAGLRSPCPRTLGRGKGILEGAGVPQSRPGFSKTRPVDLLSAAGAGITIRRCFTIAQVA